MIGMGFASSVSRLNLSLCEDVAVLVVGVFLEGIVWRLVVDGVVLMLTIVVIVLTSGDFAAIANFAERVIKVIATKADPILCFQAVVVPHLRKCQINIILIRYLH
jgi:hypothetical protein